MDYDFVFNAESAIGQRFSPALVKLLAKPNRLSFADARSKMRQAMTAEARKEMAGELDRRFKKLWRLRFKG
jgi:hypothetical protein